MLRRPKFSKIEIVAPKEEHVPLFTVMLIKMLRYPVVLRMCDSQLCRIRNLILGSGKGGVVVQGDNESVGCLKRQTGGHGSLNPLQSLLSYVHSHIGHSIRRGNIPHVISHVASHADKHRAHWSEAIPSLGRIFSRPVRSG
jgi:hypothetical protein